MDSLAFEAYLSQRHQVELKVSKPPDDEVTTILADSRWTLTELRTAVAKLYELDPSNTRLHRGYGHTNGQEIKDNHSTIALINLYTGHHISVSVGKATPAGFFNIAFVLFAPKDRKSQLVALPKEEGVEEPPVVELSDPDKVKEGSAYYWNDVDANYSFGIAAEKENHAWQYEDGEAATDADDAQMPALISEEEAQQAEYEAFVRDEVLLEDDNMDTMSNEGVADSAECFSAVAEDDMVMLDDGYGNLSSLKEEINSSERTESYRTFGPDCTQVMVDDGGSNNNGSYSYSNLDDDHDLQAAIAASNSHYASMQGLVVDSHPSSSSVVAVADAYPLMEVSADAKLPATDTATAPADVICSDTHIPSVFDDDYGLKPLDRPDDNVDPSDFGERMVCVSFVRHYKCSIIA